MKPSLVLGPLLRYADEDSATVWVETGAPCEVTVRLGPGRDHRSRTFTVEGHHYALVVITGLERGSVNPYDVLLDGGLVWPQPGSAYPRSVIRTSPQDGELDLAFGSCRVSVPHEEPYTKSKGVVRRGGADGKRYERDALYALAQSMRREPPGTWPDALLLLGDQIYADEPSAGTIKRIASRRDPEYPPGVADFEEYTSLYHDAWSEPAIRWLLSTVPSAMIFDDHDVHDDWNASQSWVETMRQKAWWDERIVGAFSSYWVYQHLGNLSPSELEEDEMFARTKESEDVSRAMREFAHRADREVEGTRWSYHRDFGNVRLIVTDSRAGRVLTPGNRSMLDDREWSWLREKAEGDFDHLLFGTSMPLLLSPGFHHLEAASEAICDGVWGRRAARAGEFMRQLVDLEHWAAFHDSFEDLTSLLRSVASGERSSNGAPACVVVLSGDVHHGYLAEATLGDGAHNPVYQAVGSPLRNPLGVPERLFMLAGWSKAVEAIGKRLARLAGVTEPPVRWRLRHDTPWFDNHISVLRLRGRGATISVQKTSPTDTEEKILAPILERKLA